MGPHQGHSLFAGEPHSCLKHLQPRLSVKQQQSKSQRYTSQCPSYITTVELAQEPIIDMSTAMIVMVTGICLDHMICGQRRVGKTIRHRDQTAVTVVMVRAPVLEVQIDIGTLHPSADVNDKTQIIHIMHISCIGMGGIRRSSSWSGFSLGECTLGRDTSTAVFAQITLEVHEINNNKVGSLTMDIAHQKSARER